jgi:hypothetical protein
MPAALPIRRDLRAAYLASLLVAAGITLVSVIGLARAPGGFYDSTQSVLVSQGADAANLLVALPILLASMWLAHRGSLVALLLWPGALCYLLYAYLPYLIGAPFTPLVFGYVLIVVAAVVALTWVVASSDGDQVRAEFLPAPARQVGIALVVVAVLAYAGLLATAVDALSGPANDATWRGHWVADWVLGTPILLLGGVQLWRGTPLGYLAAPGLLLVSGLGGIAFATAATIDNLAGGLATDWSVVIVHLVISAASYSLLAWYLQRRHRPGSQLPTQLPTPQLVRTPDDDRERRDQRQDGPIQGLGTDQ